MTRAGNKPIRPIAPNLGPVLELSNRLFNYTQEHTADFTENYWNCAS